MQLYISMAHEGDDGELDSLYRWLSNDVDLVSRVELTRGSDENRPGAMGPDPLTISAVVSAGAAALSSAAALISAIASWRNTRPLGSAEVAVTAGSGTEPITLSDEERRSPEELSRQMAGEARTQDPT